MAFFQWLHSKYGRAAGADQLLDDLKAHQISLTASDDSLAAVILKINQSSADPDLKKEFTRRMEGLWTKFETKDRDIPELRPQRWYNLVLSRDGGLFIIGILLILVVSYAFFGKYNIIGRLSDIKTARGLITFLFALGTIGSALIIIISVFTSSLPPEESKERFYRAKEILTILIGILGTIVGFYFGTPIDNKGSGELRVSAPMVSPENPVAGQPFTLISQAKGGAPPYLYSLQVVTEENGPGQPISGHLKGGLLAAPLTLDQGDYNIKIIFVDSDNNTLETIAKVPVAAGTRTE